MRKWNNYILLYQTESDLEPEKEMSQKDHGYGATAVMSKNDPNAA
jgi:hypothetical protein